MKAYGERRYSSTHFFPQHYLEIKQLQASGTLSQGKSPQYPSNRRSVRPNILLGAALLRTGRQFRNIIWKCATGISFVINTNLCYLYLRLSICKFKHINLEVQHMSLTCQRSNVGPTNSRYVRRRFAILAQPPPQRNVQISWIRTQTVARQTHHAKVV